MNFFNEKTYKNGGSAFFGDMDISLRSIGYFIKVVEYGNISKAAEDLYVSQPYLSKTIKGLEERLGFDLFKREKNKLIITAEGAEFYKAAKPMVYTMQKSIENIREMKSPKINMAVVYTLDFLKMRKKEIVNKDFPIENCSVEYLDHFKITQKLEDGLIDTAISTQDYDILLEDFDTFPIGKVNRAIVVSSENKLAERESVSLEDLSDKEVVFCIESNWNFDTCYFMLEKYCKEKGIKVSNMTFKENYHTSLLSVLSDKNKFFIGHDLLPYSIYDGLVSIPIEGFTEEIIAIVRKNLSEEKKELVRELYSYNEMA